MPTIQLSNTKITLKSDTQITPLPIGTKFKCIKTIPLRYRYNTNKVVKGETVMISKIVEYRGGGFFYHCVITGTDIRRAPRMESINICDLPNLKQI